MENTEEKKYWSLQEIADLFRLNKETVRRWILRRKLPAIKLGGNWRVEDKIVEQVKKGIIKI